MWQYNKILFLPFDLLSIFIQDITMGTKLTRHWNIRDQIDTIKRLRTKLKYVVKSRDQICSLPLFLLYKPRIIFDTTLYFIWYILEEYPYRINSRYDIYCRYEYSLTYLLVPPSMSSQTHYQTWGAWIEAPPPISYIQMFCIVVVIAFTLKSSPCFYCGGKKKWYTTWRHSHESWPMTNNSHIHMLVGSQLMFKLGTLIIFTQKDTTDLGVLIINWGPYCDFTTKHFE